MPFGSGNPTLTKENPPGSEVARFFQKPLQKADVVGAFEKAKPIPGADWDMKYRYSKKMKDGFLYLVATTEEGKSVDKITLDLSRNNEDVNELRFLKSEVDFGGIKRKVWDFQHRLVQSQEFGVTGTDFFNRAQEYLTILMKEKKIEHLPLYAEIGQPNVAQWLIKNGFELDDTSKKKLESVEKDPNYSLMREHVSGDSFIKDDFGVDTKMVKDLDMQNKYNMSLRPDKKKGPGKELMHFDQDIVENNLPFMVMLKTLKELSLEQK